MERRDRARLKAKQPPSANATIFSTTGSMMSHNTTVVKLHNFGLEGLSFTSELEFSIHEYLAMHLDLFSPKTQVCGEIVWKKEANNSFIYGLNIHTADFTYHQYMHSYEKYLENRDKGLA
ncbi:hypothetical protein GH741_01185 [Aquibacillus halophilus]|uniref:PilZ domain-containing protein n=1 Tax=Aquibacillus halophilus TaxID=930132 RepID=A0A6A8D6Q1_9BACI|nr:hypothetical protein [Aquibacillus halophilus]MRH41284.1 hypothetical protein [Aquibacillus halophilus]